MKYTVRLPQYHRNKFSIPDHSVPPEFRVVDSGDDGSEGSEVLQTSSTQTGLQPFSPMTKSQIFSRSQMWPDMSSITPDPTPGPSGCPRDPRRSIGHHRQERHICRGV